MLVSDRAHRLKVETRLAILENITALNRQRKAAIQAGDTSQVTAIQDSINALTDQLDDLSFLSLESLEDSPEVNQTITALRGAALELESQADTIKNVADAVQKAAQIINVAAKIVTQLSGLATAAV